MEDPTVAESLESPEDEEIGEDLGDASRKKTPGVINHEEQY